MVARWTTLEIPRDDPALASPGSEHKHGPVPVPPVRLRLASGRAARGGPLAAILRFRRSTRGCQGTRRGDRLSRRGFLEDAAGCRLRDLDARLVPPGRKTGPRCLSRHREGKLADAPDHRFPQSSGHRRPNPRTWSGPGILPHSDRAFPFTSFESRTRSRATVPDAAGGGAGALDRDPARACSTPS